MHYSKIDKCSLVDGVGIRTTLFVSGCTHNCPSCHNHEAQNFRFGRGFTQDTIKEILQECSNEYCAGLSLSGGDPLHPKNVPDVLELVQEFREVFGDGKNVWCWTGYTLEHLQARKDWVTSLLLSSIDVLVDGPFIEALKDPSLKFRGSSNQRILYRGIDF